MCTLHARDPCRPALLCVHEGSFESTSSQVSGKVWGLEGMAGLPKGTGGGENEMERDNKENGNREGRRERQGTSREAR